MVDRARIESQGPCPSFTAQKEIGLRLRTLPGGGCGRARDKFRSGTPSSDPFWEFFTLSFVPVARLEVCARPVEINAE